MKTRQLTKKHNHRPNWPNCFLILGTGILALIVLFKERGLVNTTNSSIAGFRQKKVRLDYSICPFRFFRWNELNS